MALIRIVLIGFNIRGVSLERCLVKSLIRVISLK